MSLSLEVAKYARNWFVDLEQWQRDIKTMYACSLSSIICQWRDHHGVNLSYVTIN